MPVKKSVTKSWNLQYALMEKKFLKQKASKDESPAHLRRFNTTAREFAALRRYVRSLTPAEREAAGDATVKPEAFGAKVKGR